MQVEVLDILIRSRVRQLLVYKFTLIIFRYTLLNKQNIQLMLEIIVIHIGVVSTK